MLDDEFFWRLRDLYETLDNPELQAVREALNSPELQAVRAALDNLELQAMREALDNPELQMIREALDNSELKAIREALDNPELQAIREALDNPELQMIREALDNPKLQMIREALDNPKLQMIREALDNPELQMIREALDNPELQAMRDALDNPELQIMREEQRQLDSITAAQRQLDSITAAHRQLDSITAAQRQLDSIARVHHRGTEHRALYPDRASFRQAIAQMSPTLDQFNSLRASIALRNPELFQSPSELSKLVLHLRDQLIEGRTSLGQLESIRHSLAPDMDAFISEQATLANLIDDLSSRQFSIEPFERIIDAIATIEATAQLYHASDQALALALGVPIGYQTFSIGQMESAEKASGKARERRIETIEAAGEIVEINEEAFQLGVMASDVRVIDKDQRSSESEKLESDEGSFATNVFSILDESLEHVYGADFSGDVATEVGKALPTRICALGRAIIEIVFHLNRLFESRGDGPLFKPTTMTMYAFALLPSSIACDSRRFSQLVDHLYFLFYEGSSEAKRLLTLVNDNDLEALWRLKHLRLGFRHDMDHGKPGAVTSKQAKVGLAYNALIGKPYPATRIDWIRSQLALYEQLLGLLNRLLGKSEQ